MRPRITAVLALAAVAAGCSQQPSIVPSRNFDRPTDMTFGCMGLFEVEGKLQASGRPMAECHPPEKADPLSDTAHRTFGFVTNTARGELSVVDLDHSRLVDLDPAVAGFNTVPLGVLPEALAITDDGCRMVSANRGSCDLTVIDPGALMQPQVAREYGADLPQPDVAQVAATIMVKTRAGGPLSVAPYEVQFLPQYVKNLTGNLNLCAPLAQAPPDISMQWKALVTFPSCDLVALVDLPSGVIVDSVFVRAAADGKSVVLEPGGSEPRCPYVDCGPGPRPMQATTDAGPSVEAGPDATPETGPDANVDVIANADANADVNADADAIPDAGVGPGTDADTDTTAGIDASSPDTGDGGSAPPPVRVVDKPFIGPGALGAAHLAIHPNGDRAYVGLTNASFVAAIEIVNDTLTAPATGASIYLHEGALGSNRIRLSVDPFLFREDGRYGKFVGGNQSRQYLYVIARDGSVRVISVAARPETECDTNIDPLLVPEEVRTDPARTDTACFPVDPSRRRALAIGPGIPVPTLPRDIAFADLKVDVSDELNVDGVFGFILTTSGSVYIVNIDPTRRKVMGVGEDGMPKEIMELPPLVNTLRDRNVLSYTRQLDPSAGPARLDINPVAPPVGPRLEGIYATSTDDNATAAGTPVRTYAFFPDRSTVTAQSWSITWEGAFFPDPRYSAQLEGPFASAAGPAIDAILRDRGGAFCRLGVLAGDIVTLNGCSDNGQCGLGQVCVRSPAAPQSFGGLPINGLCLSPLKVKQEQEKAMCGKLLDSVRRYEVVKAHPTELILRPRIDEVVMTSLTPCKAATKDADGNEVRDTCRLPDDPTHDKFECVAGRCLQPCTKAGVPGAASCRVGRDCVDFGVPIGGNGQTRFCADAPELPAAAPGAPDLLTACFPQLTSYRVYAGRAFLVQGSASARPSTALEVPDPEPPHAGETNPDRLICVEDTTRNPLLATRIRMTAPHCTNVDDNELDSGLPPEASTEATRNGLLTIARTKPVPNPCLYVGGPNEGDPRDPSKAPPTHVRALFQNAELRFILSNLEEAFGDTTQIRFEVHGGFRPQSVLIPPDSIDIGMPARLLVSPLSAIDAPAGANGVHELPYLFVVDQRRLGRTRGSSPTRGQLLRIHPQGQFQKQPIYQDYSSSQGLFPIQ